MVRLQMGSIVFVIGYESEIHYLHENAHLFDSSHHDHDYTIGHHENDYENVHHPQYQYSTVDAGLNSFKQSSSIQVHTLFKTHPFVSSLDFIEIASPT